MMHKSVSTIDSPEFINLQPLDINPLMQSCEIKVFYLGQNRNHSFINKQVATEMAKTLRGAPIVGYFRQDKEDFGDHGNKVIIDGDGIKFQCQTKPYGFVAPDAKVWFQKFDEEDDFGNSVTRQYLMTTGYLWSGQFQECKDVLNNGRPHSMQLDEESLNGQWSVDSKSGIQFFIINDAIFSKLCILGNDVEPCFEGSSVKAPEVSKNFSLDDGFKATLFSMMKDLENVVKEGGAPMEELETKLEQEVVETEEVEVEAPAEEVEGAGSEFKKQEDEDKDKEEDTNQGEDKQSDDKQQDQDEEKKKKYALMEQQVNSLQTEIDTIKSQYQALVTECESLRAFKASVEDAKKDELIKSFYMLSDEDKQDVIQNKSQYSYDEIEAKLSVICVRKKVSFTNEDENNDGIADSNPVTLFNLDSNIEDSLPPYIRALRENKNNRNA